MTILKKICYFFGKKKMNKEQEQNTFYLSGIMNKILTVRYERNCDNIVYLLHKSKTFINTSDSVLG